MQNQETTEIAEGQRPLPYDPDWIPTDLETWLIPAILWNILLPFLKNAMIYAYFAAMSRGIGGSAHPGIIALIIGVFFLLALHLMFFLFPILWFIFHLAVALDTGKKGVFRRFRYVWRKLFLLVASFLPMLPSIYLMFYMIWCRK